MPKLTPEQIVAEIRNSIRDDLVSAADIAFAVRAMSTGKQWDQMLALTDLLRAANCKLTKLLDGWCPCERCSKPDDIEHSEHWGR